jgi:RNA polymerase sigma-70 factor (ECF subfamily)
VDRTLVERAMAGDHEAFSALARASADRLHAIAYRILRDADLAADAVQQALVISWKQLPRLRDPDRFQAWLTRLLVHECYAEARRGVRWVGNVAVLGDRGDQQGDHAAQLADRDQIERGFRRLHPEQRAVVVLHYYLGLSQAQIAEQLDVPLGTVKSRMHAATASLRAALEADARVAGMSARESR